MNLLQVLSDTPISGSSPPTEFRIFARGWNETSKGRFLFDDTSAESVLAAYRDQGNELCLDYDHKAVDQDARAGDGKAAGWFTLEVREDGLWAVGIRWTPPAEEALRNREWRYVSPAFVAEPKTRRIVSLLNVALTNLPATKRMQPLVAATSKDLVHPVAPSQKDLLRMTRKHEDELVEDDIEDENDEEISDRDQADQDGASAEESDDEDDEETGKPRRKASRVSIVAAAQALTGKRSPSEVIGVLQAHKHAREQVTLLSDRVKRLEHELREQQVQRIVRRAEREGKIPPSLRAWALGLGRQDLEQLQAYVAQAAPLVSQPMRPPAEEAIMTLNADEHRVCELLGVSPDLYLKTRGARS